MSAVIERSLDPELSVLDIEEDLLWHRDGDVTILYRIGAFHEPSMDDDAMNASAFLAENAWSGLPEGTRYQFYVLLDQSAAAARLKAALPPIPQGGAASPLLDDLREWRLKELTRQEDFLVAQDRRHYLAATFRPSCFKSSSIAAATAPLRRSLVRLGLLRAKPSHEEALRREILLEASQFERRVTRGLSSQEGLSLERCRTREIAAFVHEILNPAAAVHQPLEGLSHRRVDVEGALPPSIVEAQPYLTDVSRTLALLEDDVAVHRRHLWIAGRYATIISMKELPDRTEPALLVPLLRLGREKYRLVYTVDIPERAEEISALRRKAALAEGLRRTTVVETERTDPHADAVSAQSTEAMRKMFSSTQRLFGVSLQVVLVEKTPEALEEAVQETLSSMASAQGMRGYRETFLLKPLLLSHVPGAPAVAERRRKTLTPVMVDMQPVFDFRSGDATRGVPLVTRDRSLVFYDPFDTRAQSNANVLVTGTSGAGKSVAVQVLISGYEIAASCHGLEAPHVFIIDNGESYKRYVDLRREDGRHIAFSFSEPPGCDVFAFDDAKDDRDEHVSRLQWLLVDLLRFDQSREEEFEAKKAVLERALFDLYGDDSERRAPRSFAGLASILALSPGGQEMAGRLRTFIDGKFSRLFAPNPGLAVGDDVRVVCYDFKLLAEHPDLALIALRLVIFEIRRLAARRHRVSGRRARTFLVLDESWALLDAATGGAMAAMAAPFLAASVRMGRKEGLSTIALSQQIEDFAQSGYGAAILGNSATKLVGRPGKEGVDGVRKHLQLTDRQVDQIRRLVCNEKYHEFLLIQGDVTNVVRLSLDPLSRWIFTSSPDDRDRIDQLARSRGDLDLMGRMRLLARETEAARC